MSRDVTQENRQDKSREEKTTTREEVRLLLSGTPLSKVTDQELDVLAKRHGPERLLLAADVAAETWRRYQEETHNPGGYLHSLCTSLVVPEWYVPFAERKAKALAHQQRREAVEAEKAAAKAREEELAMARTALWESLLEEEREKYRSIAVADLPAGLAPAVAVTARAKLLAWEARQARLPAVAG